MSPNSFPWILYPKKNLSTQKWTSIFNEPTILQKAFNMQQYEVYFCLLIAYLKEVLLVENFYRHLH